MRFRPVALLLAAAAALVWCPAAAADNDQEDEEKQEEPRILATHALGLRYIDRENNIEVHAGGIVALDFASYGSDNRREKEWRFDRSIVRLDGQFADTVELRIGADVNGRETEGGLDEAWASLRLSDLIRITAGLIDVPLGVNASTAEESLSLTNYAFPVHIGGRTDWGARLDGEIDEGTISYEVAGTVGSGFDRFGQVQKGTQVAGRLLVYPLKWTESSFEILGTEVPFLSGFFAGAAYSSVSEYAGELDISNTVDNKLFSTGELEADTVTCIGVSAGFDMGPARLFGDFVVGSMDALDTPQGEIDIENDIVSWHVTFAATLTGEPYDSRPGRQRRGRPRPFPAHELDFTSTEGYTGAWEVAVRYSVTRMPEELFDTGLADSSFSARDFRSVTAAVNWFPNAYLRFTLAFERTSIRGNILELGNDDEDLTWVFRVQYSF